MKEKPYTVFCTDCGEECKGYSMDGAVLAFQRHFMKRHVAFKQGSLDGMTKDAYLMGADTSDICLFCGNYFKNYSLVPCKITLPGSSEKFDWREGNVCVTCMNRLFKKNDDGSYVNESYVDIR